MTAITLFDGFFRIYGLLILGRVLYSWVDQNPYPTNPIQQALWAATDPVIRQALSEAGLTLDQIAGVAVSQGPGLVGSLLVGVCAAKAIAWYRGLPLLAVNHLEGHIRSVFIENPSIEFPAIAFRWTSSS